MKSISKILCALLVLTMVFAMFSVSASAIAFPNEQSDNATLSDGNSDDIVGIPTNATNVQYLSDEGVEPVDYRSLYQNSTEASGKPVPAVRNNEAWYVTNANTYRFVGGVKSKNADDIKAKIFLGFNGTEYAKGLGVYAGSSKAGYDFDENYLTYAVPAGANRFYAVTGNNGNNVTQTDPEKQYSPVRFELWGGNSADGEFTLLAYAECKQYRVAEFNVDITGYTYVKLVHKQAEAALSAGTGLECVWANACVYTASEEVVPPTTETPTEAPTTPAAPTVGAPTATPTEAPSNTEEQPASDPAVFIIAAIVVVVIAAVAVVIIRKKNGK